MTQSQLRALFGVLLIIAGIVVAVVGYLGVSGETVVAFQLPYFASAGVGALMLLGGGAALLVVAQIERDSTRLDDLESATRQLAGEISRLLDKMPANSNDRGRDASPVAGHVPGGARQRTKASTHAGG